MKMTINSFYNVEPLEIKRRCVSFDNRDSDKVIRNNLRVGANLFKYLYCKIPSNIWDGFEAEALKHDIVITHKEESHNG